MFSKMIGGFLDNFKAADFAIKGTMKIKTLQEEFKKNFGLTLRVYNGVKFADGDKTLASLKSTKAGGTDFTLKAKMKVSDVEKVFADSYGLKVQVADIDNSKLLPNSITLGQGLRGEYEK